MDASTIAMVVAKLGLKEVHHVLLFLFMPSPSRYGPKREGHPCMEKGINMTVSIIQFK